VSQLTEAVSRYTTWRTVSTYADSTGIGLSRGQADPNNFGYTLAATVSVPLSDAVRQLEYGQLIITRRRIHVWWPAPAD